MKKTAKNLAILNAIFVTALVISNIVGSKILGLSFYLCGTQVTMGAAMISYPITYVVTDIIGELFGKKEANRTVLYGFIGQIVSLLLILVACYLPAANSDTQAAFELLLGQNYIFVAGSIISYLCSQSWDVFVFHKVRDRYIKKHGSIKGGRWIWNNASTMTSQLIDSIMYSGIVFGIGFKWLAAPDTRVALAVSILGVYIVKLIVAAIDTPFFYFFTRREKNEACLEEKAN